MKAYFSINHNPDSKDLKDLSEKTQLPKRVLQVWFQNSRAKWRRNILKQQSLGPQIVEECKPLAELDRECHLITSSSGGNNNTSNNRTEHMSPLTIRQEEQTFYTTYLSCNGNAGDDHSNNQNNNLIIDSNRSSCDINNHL
ncbi:LIM/homeobox protein Lhx9-like protein [Dinothrombium tinctorium]|uniref:LIM/homeobox protein Lhx9-like protein n=1 Tax=Dinothrombium tinctorium TaxID=1965070 RepID=A0A443RKJ2_9ACAR|nr:LIM/homeobox protein Lhx9-like protein [Dinothrombium tinctorium]